MRRDRKMAGLSAAALFGAALIVALPSGTVMADDGGARAFMLEQSGFGAPPRPVYDLPDTRPLVVRPHRRTAARKPETKIAVGPTAPVSIYDDPTLRPGDAVMTTKGLRVFMGGHAAPYTDTDFVALSEADGLPRQLEKSLVQIDKAPHG